MGRPTFVHIDLDALEYNLNAVRDKVGDDVAVWPIVKADAYALGAVPIAMHLERMGADGFGVATVEEGVELREGGITKPVLVMAGVYVGEGIHVKRHRLEPVIYSRQNLLETAAEARRLGAVFDVHLKVNTGMNRLGVFPEAIPSIIEDMRKAGGLRLKGVMSHLAMANAEFAVYTNAQITRFNEAIKALEQMGEKPKYKHICATAGVVGSRGGSGLFNAVRPGILMYGEVPNPELHTRIDVRPAVTLATEIIRLRNLGIGESISYGGTFVTKRDSIIAVAPIGYADGLPRILSNQGEMIVRGQRVPIAGTICMDLTMLDVTDVPGVKVGDQVVVFGSQNGETIPLQEVATKAQTHPYEILTGIGKRVHRIYRHHMLAEPSV